MPLTCARASYPAFDPIFQAGGPGPSVSSRLSMRERSRASKRLRPRVRPGIPAEVAETFRRGVWKGGSPVRGEEPDEHLDSTQAAHRPKPSDSALELPSMTGLWQRSWQQTMWQPGAWSGTSWNNACVFPQLSGMMRHR